MTAAEIFATGDYAGAVTAYRAELGLDPNSITLKKGLGTALVMTGDTATGLPFLAEAADRQPGNGEFRYAYGFGLAQSGDLDLAVKEFDACLALQPDHRAAKPALVNALLKLGTIADVASAEAYFDRARKVDPKNPDAWGAYLSYLVKTDQKGKVKNLIPTLPDVVKLDARMAATLQSMPDEFKPTAPAPAAPSAVSPAVRAAVGNIAPGAMPAAPAYQPRYRDQSQKAAWQPIAYNIVCGLWLLSAAWTLITALIANVPFATPFLATLSAIQLAVVTGLLLRNEWVAIIGKAMCYLTIMGQIFPFWTSMGRGRWGEFAVSLLTIGLAGFMIYLIGHENDD
jgi:tetratricopeptide (TPR) repeat protein